ncbi:MAG: L-rhamnose isomerase [Candidatus Aminicenantes bacterium]|nr:L-rhamnose isomerase [Candidatus Aminicenantes bacterium]
MNPGRIERAYKIAQELYADHGVDTDKALKKLTDISISLHCWQGDDVGGFERPGAGLTDGGLQVTGSHPGKARTIDELRADLHRAFSLIPGAHRLNLHAMYGEFGGKKVDRDEIGADHFRGWVDWAKREKLKLDFNATCFSHPQAADGFTLSHREKAIRKFWIDHVMRCRKVSAFIGREMKSACLHNLWIPDGSKEVPVDRLAHRTLLKESLDEIYAVDYSPAQMKDSLESKLFGIGSEAFVVGSHEFYLGYALSKNKMVCLDLGHFHPTESIADKISGILPFAPGLAFHLSRGIRWDSDHVVTFNDDIQAVAEEIVRCRALDRSHIALDYFDASLNRVGAWVIGARATLKAFLCALLLPEEKLRAFEKAGDNFGRLSLREEAKSLPWGAVWDQHCFRADVPPGSDWLDEISRYEREVLSRRP